MKKLLIMLAASSAFAVPAAAQGPIPGAEADAQIVASLPSSHDVEAIAPVLDRSFDAMLDLDVGPLMDAADPYARHPGYGRPGRTLRRMGRHRDPYFEQRVRGSIYGATSELGRMMDSLAVAAPAMRRSLFEMQLGIAAAVDDYHHRRGDRYDRRYDERYRDEPYYDEPYYDED